MARKGVMMQMSHLLHWEEISVFCNSMHYRQSGGGGWETPQVNACVGLRDAHDRGLKTLPET